jgi:hypothetical protein
VQDCVHISGMGARIEQVLLAQTIAVVAQALLLAYTAFAAWETAKVQCASRRAERMDDAEERLLVFTDRRRANAVEDGPNKAS